ncbi:MAG: DUF4097 family beta strand repeat protein [Blastocatellia bacterium]|nr:DUF4097 family beta strand repeat protein [Blastocatellia bacterium]
MSKLYTKGLCFALQTFLVLTAAIAAVGQTTTVGPPKTPGPTSTPGPKTTPGPPTAPTYSYSYSFDGVTTERVLKADPRIKLDLCITRGTIRVNGSSNGEVRVFVKNGSKFGFKVHETNAKTGLANWVDLIQLNEQKPGFTFTGECIWGEDIEIDLPEAASISIKGKDITASIDSVRRAVVKSIGGALSLRNVTGGIDANTGQGSLLVESSQGTMSLESTNGNIVVVDAGPAESGDTFTAKTSRGAVSLNDLQFRRIDVKSTSGSVAFNGTVLRGADYSFDTSTGSIGLTLPKETSCTVQATYRGRIESALPLNIVTENVQPGSLKSINATLGKGGESSLRLISNVGSITIRQQ